MCISSLKIVFKSLITLIKTTTFFTKHNTCDVKIIPHLVFAIEDLSFTHVLPSPLINIVMVAENIVHTTPLRILSTT